MLGNPLILTMCLIYSVLNKESFILNNEGDIKDYYDFDTKILGEGTYGVARKATEKSTGALRAVKSIKRTKIRNYSRFLNEINALKTLDHPNVVKLFEVFQDDENIHLVMEYLSGGELFEYILKKDSLDEPTAARIMAQILQAVLYCHKNAICHRDLKPENFMFESADEDCNLKLIDFGFAQSYYKISDEGTGKYIRMKTKAGTAYFMAPEILQDTYTNACDMWSVGVILYILLSGYPPFDGDTEEEILREVQKMKPDYSDEVWLKVSKEAKDLLGKLLVPENERLSPKEALKHDWFLMNFDLSSPKKGKINSVHMNRLREFHRLEQFKKLVFTYMASRTSDRDIIDEIKEFRKYDKNNDGYITLKELKQALKGEMTKDELTEILKGIDTDRNGAINYTEFIAATMDRVFFHDKTKLENAFNFLDVNGDGNITIADLDTLFKKSSTQIYDKQILQELIKQ